MTRRVCVFAGSSSGRRPDYAEAAADLGRAIVGRGWGVVFGGGRVGLMGVLADAAMQAGGEVIGVIPEALATKEVAHRDLTSLEVVDGMHDRKARMAELAFAFVALPGGIGTLEETFEVYTWGQLGFHAKPTGLLNVAGYWDHLCGLLDRAVAERFLSEVHRDMLIVEDASERLLDRLDAYRAPRLPKWLDEDEL
ncbi:MAG: TIGR00730 family Rossman fold protein [Thermoanaerobaculia bacterium]|nr:TIGR00730 family Rossman fold protein [Thermoanaerobaculia bacterium]